MRKNNVRVYKDPRGFTLIELMISASLIAVLSIAVFSVFSRGMDVWKRVKTLDRTEEDIRFALEKFSRELRTSFEFTPAKFQGAKDRIVFSTLIRFNDPDGLPMERIGRVTYLFSPEEKAVFRREEGYRDLFHADRAPLEKFMAPVDEAVFAYYTFDSGEKKYGWKDSWKEPLRPAGVQLTLTVPDTHGKQKHIVKTVFFR